MIPMASVISVIPMISMISVISVISVTSVDDSHGCLMGGELGNHRDGGGTATTVATAAVSATPSAIHVAVNDHHGVVDQFDGFYLRDNGDRFFVHCACRYLVISFLLFLYT